MVIIGIIVEFSLHVCNALFQYLILHYKTYSFKLMKFSSEIVFFALNVINCRIIKLIFLNLLYRLFSSLQKLHLPPELSDTASRSQEDPVERKINKRQIEF